MHDFIGLYIGQNVIS